MQAALIVISLLAAEPGEVWPSFRGTGNSRTEAKNLPLRWSDENNIAWRTDLPGYGQSSPVAWKNSAFVTAVQGEFKERLLVLAVNISDGKIAWRKEFAASERIKDSNYVGKAAPTPVVDSERLFVFYESGDLIALNHQGDQLWKRSLTKEHGKIQGAHGLGGSLAQTDDAVIVLIDHGGPSYLLAVDKKTGETQWKTDRSGGTSWSSPIVSKRGGQTEILVSGAGTLDGYDAGTGKRKWTVKGLTGNNVPSPTASGDLIVVGAQEPQSNLAVRVKTNGDATAAEVAWRAKKASSSFGSPLIHRGHVYFVNRAGAASCLDLKTGEPRWTERLPGSTWASALGAGDRVYFFTQEGAAAVFAAGGELKLLAENKLTVGKRLYGFAAINGALILRGGNQLIRVGK